MGFLTDFETTVTTAFDTVIGVANGNLLTVFKGGFAAGLGVWLMLIAYETAWGKSEDGLTFAITKIARVFAIGVIALYGWPFVIELVDAVREGLIVSLGGSSTMAGVLETNLIDPLLNTFKELWKNFLLSFAGFGPTDVVDALVAILVGLLMFIAYSVLAIMVAILVIVSFAIYFVAFAGFKLFSAVGPFFLLCLAFPFTQRFFESWVGAMITASLAMAFAAFLATLASAWLGLSTIVPPIGVPINFDTSDLPKVFLGKAVVAALIVYLYMKIFDYAAQLGGGLNMGNNMYGAMRNIANDLRRGGSASRNSNTTQNTINRGNSGGQSGASRTRDSNRQYQTMTAAAIAAGGRSAALGVRGASTASRLAYQRGIRPVAAVAGQAAARGTVAVGRAAYVGGAAVVRAARNVASRGIPGITS